MTSAQPGSERCGICGSDDRPYHDELVANKVLHHKWSVDGNLEAVHPTPPAKRQPPKNQIMVVGAIDISLRKLLHDKGIISDEDFAALCNPGTRPAGDREAGEAPSP